MARNMMKIIKDTIGKIPDDYDMTYKELMKFLETAISGKPAEAISWAFIYGFALALRMQKNNEKKGKRYE